MANFGYTADTAFAWPEKTSRVEGNTAMRDNGFPAMGVDWWHVRLRAGKRYRIQMRRPSFGPESGSYRYLSLYDSLANAQGNNYWTRSYRYGDDGNYFPLIEITPSGAGATDWWLKVDDGNNGYNGYRGAYVLEILPIPVAEGKRTAVALPLARRAIRTANTGAFLSATPDAGGVTTGALHETPGDGAWRGICWSDERRLFVAVASGGGGGRVMTGPDGRAWTGRDTPAANAWRSVCWSPALGRFVAVASTGYGNRAMTSDDGEAWTLRASAADNSWTSVCWASGLGRYVAVASSGVLRAMTSPDGKTWTAHPTPEGAWSSVCWAGELGLLVAVGYDGAARIMTSPDGATWTARRAPVANDWRSVCWSPELRRLVAVASSGTGNRVMVSQDGEAWLSGSTGTDAAWQGVVWSPERNLFLCLGGAYIGRSAEGFVWTVAAAPANQTWEDVCWSREAAVFAGVSSTGTAGRALTFAVTPRIDTAAHAILRDGRREAQAGATCRVERRVRDWRYGIKTAVLRERHRTAAASARGTHRGVGAAEIVYAEPATGFHPLQNPQWPRAVHGPPRRRGTERRLSRHPGNAPGLFPRHAAARHRDGERVGDPRRRMARGRWLPCPARRFATPCPVSRAATAAGPRHRHRRHARPGHGGGKRRTSGRVSFAGRGRPGRRVRDRGARHRHPLARRGLPYLIYTRPGFPAGACFCWSTRKRPPRPPFSPVHAKKTRNLFPVNGLHASNILNNAHLYDTQNNHKNIGNDLRTGRR